MTAPTGRDRITERFAELKRQGRSGLVTYVTAGDPDAETSFALLRRLPAAGADLVELGMAFTDPMADGPAIQAAGLRALQAGASLARTLDMVRRFRGTDGDTPLVLMGYYNPIARYGVPRFLSDAVMAGVDGLIVVDLPPEEDDELCLPAREAGLHFIRLATPTTDAQRLPKVLRHASGFLYYVAIAGITGTAAADRDKVAEAMARLRPHTPLPIAVGFGIKTPSQAAAIAGVADAAVVGSAIVDRIAANLAADGRAGPRLVDDVIGFVGSLAAGVRGGQR